jgi:hypothetical protein
MFVFAPFFSVDGIDGSDERELIIFTDDMYATTIRHDHQVQKTCEQ